MKHLPSPVDVASETQVKMPTRRALAKQQTRSKVLAAARRLFSEQGYEGATIRDIAMAAGMSTGAVFASFADKSELFREILTNDIGALGEAMREGGRRGRDVEDKLLKIFMAGYAFYEPCWT
jgi:AcrR family transcriptional regulator